MYRVVTSAGSIVRTRDFNLARQIFDLVWQACLERGTGLRVVALYRDSNLLVYREARP